MNPEKPVYRRLRAYAFDPGMTAQMDTALINEVVLPIPWEPLEPGPVGEYVAVLDQDDSGRPLYPSVDLDHPYVLARDGLPASDGNPQFHQQMVYAVVMHTIGVFERALGRKIHWSQRGPEYRRQIGVYPHFMRVANAYYDPRDLTIRFGYFEAPPNSPFPGMVVLTCLSLGTIAHTVCHALLEGTHLHYAEQSNLDVGAFHEGFCDTVPLLLRFSLPSVLRQQLASARGDLTARTQLGVLAQQFGEALGAKSGIRSALGELDEDGVWRPREPDPSAYQTVEEPHARGSILMGAIFDAFNTIYQARIADLRRIATEGTGILPEGELRPDLVGRLAQEASKTASRILDMCVRAIDYCPAVDLTFGDYLRAIITADVDLEPGDLRNYRVAFIEAFRRHGIYPGNVGTLSVETLLWPQPAPDSGEARVVQSFIRRLAGEYTAWNLPSDREALYRLMQEKARELEADLRERGGSVKGLGRIDPERPLSVQSILPRQRAGRSGEPLSQWVIQILQRPTEPLKQDDRMASTSLLVDADTGLVRYAIHKAVGDSAVRGSPEALFARSSAVALSPPHERRLRVFAFDPSLSTQVETARINQVTVGIPWEPLGKGPVGEYLEVVDYDPATAAFYDPVDLEHEYLLAEDGYPPSQGNPQFHQQMVYAVAMRTIRNFERALGRLALWSPHQPGSGDGDGQGQEGESFVQRLRLYPHALREANAFYSPGKKAVLFGYFQSVTSPNAAPVTVFSCLSHDIIAHEITHALLDGMHGRLDEPSNPDVLAFHEAFADIVALFQHFSLPEVLEHQIAATRGDLASQNRLGELAQEFGSAIGNHGALRSAIGEYDEETGEWRPRKPDPEAYVRVMEPHARGALLVATVFDAFLTIYRSRAADLFRIATKGTGVLPAGQLHPDLVRRLAEEAADSAQVVLEMCIRALDYCPPVDITFGDYLRAMITVDFELDPVDVHNRRVAFIEAFRRHGIVPDDVRAFSLEGLLWKQAKAVPDEDEELVIDFVRDWTQHIPSWNLSRNRRELFKMVRQKRIELKRFLADRAKTGKLAIMDPEYPFEVHSLRPSMRIDWQGKSHLQWIIEITQQIPEFLDSNPAQGPGAEPDYYFRGGTTMLVDARTGRVRYSIRKRLDDPRRRERQRQHVAQVVNSSLYAAYFRGVHEQEPFAALHRF